MANLETKVQAARLLVRKAAWKKDMHLPYSVDAAMAKLYCAETAMEVTTKCVQFHGGYGYTREYEVERMMRDAKITENRRAKILHAADVLICKFFSVIILVFLLVFGVF